jgi:hypothetical protein
MSSNGWIKAGSWLGWVAMSTISTSLRSSDPVEHTGSVADFEFDVGEGEGQFRKPPLVPRGATLRPEEVDPLIVVGLVDPPPSRREVRNDL